MIGSMIWHVRRRTLSKSKVCLDFSIHLNVTHISGGGGYGGGGESVGAGPKTRYFCVWGQEQD